ncbi:hypothetical protein [Desulfonema magnum]|uniref:Uncharacterized protein n=1 Tax=Desulfonema magnum TaxID=45655 RepID=A0A975BPW1_9BACT|nr:hypothetical protein [Desulfonema magnum]QTA89674.1 Uncharacterized protein dnm_057310 [Desulfonema magnum]
MLSNLQEKVFSALHISKKDLLDEMSVILASQQLSEYSMEVDFFEKKYGKKFEEFDRYFRSHEVSYEMENDWMNWKFSVESRKYWEEILKHNDS